ncbi:acyl-CoA dehydrogenase family protein [Candidatus Marimicrobium litorale]|jgi:acyl-CoA dehydrogenase|uniref:Acyl-CoA dehydrogenase n=1 Tax=Candidatus Marimicrobium litorale TaxID=2518991 RepID=A0ABT3T3T2_9GAMM|nr:acyl-CoA dehydrogenase family protein [Candidatus Marimicrobium litorale]MCX2976729.1 acyl-CoA dehydrogenase [Candidatus Marimicrobium litorale]
MAIDFTFSPEVEQARQSVRDFMTNTVKARFRELRDQEDVSRDDWSALIKSLRVEAKERGLWLPHMPEDAGGMGLGVTALAAVAAESAKVPYGPYILNAHAPDEGNMHTLYHFATEYQREHYLNPLLAGEVRSCFSMTEPEVAGSDPTLIQTSAVEDGDEWVINGHKWFTSGARGAGFAIVIARTDPDAEIPQARNSAFIVDCDSAGFELVRDIETMSGSHNHCEIRYTDVRVPKANLLGERGGGHKLGQVRLGPARLAHCMRWLGEIEMALEMLIDRAQKRFAHGSLLSEKQSIQWMMSDSAMELYASKLMVLHAAYKIEQGMDFKQEVSMAKHHVANTLWRVCDRAMQVHGALGYSTDSPLAGMLQQARWARLADGADEVHQMRIADLLMRAYNENGSVNAAVGGLPL